MGVPGLLKLLQSLYIDYDTGLHNNDYIKKYFLDYNDDIDIYFDFNSLTYLTYKDIINPNFELDENKFINNIDHILNFFFNDLKNKKYNTYVFFDGVPSYNKILN